MWLGSPPASCSSIWVTHLGKQRWQKVVKIQRTSASSQPALLHLPESSWKFKVFWKVSIDQIFWWFKQSFILWTVYWKKTNYDYHQRYRLFFPILYLRPVCPSMLCAANASKSGAAIVSLLAKSGYFCFSSSTPPAVVDKVCRLCSADKYALLHLSLSSSSSRPEVEIWGKRGPSRPDSDQLAPCVLSAAYSAALELRLLYYAETFTKNQEHRRNL